MGPARRCTATRVRSPSTAAAYGTKRPSPPDTLHEAAALALKNFRQCNDPIAQPSAETISCVETKGRAAATIKVAEMRDWLRRPGETESKRVRKLSLRAVLADC